LKAGKSQFNLPYKTKNEKVKKPQIYETQADKLEKKR